MKNQTLFSSKDKRKKIRLLQFSLSALRVKSFIIILSYIWKFLGKSERVYFKGKQLFHFYFAPVLIGSTLKGKNSLF